MPAGPSIDSSKNQKKENVLLALSKAPVQATVALIRKNRSNKGKRGFGIVLFYSESFFVEFRASKCKITLKE